DLLNPKVWKDLAKAPPVCRQGAFSARYMKSEFETECPELKSYAQEQRKLGRPLSDRQSDEQELVILTQCAQKMVQKVALGALIHEMGHNFGLRHNFKGSHDQSNFSIVKNGDKEE